MSQKEIVELANIPHSSPISSNPNINNDVTLVIKDKKQRRKFSSLNELELAVKAMKYLEKRTINGDSSDSSTNSSDSSDVSSDSSSCYSSASESSLSESNSSPEGSTFEDSSASSYSESDCTDCNEFTSDSTTDDY